jgi:hypothetical protein
MVPSRNGFGAHGDSMSPAPPAGATETLPGP